MKIWSIEDGNEIASHRLPFKADSVRLNTNQLTIIVTGRGGQIYEVTRQN